MAENDFDLSGLADLQTETATADSPTNGETVVADQGTEASAQTGETATEAAPAAPQKWTVGNTEYEDPNKLAEDYQQMLKAFTQSQQQLKANQSATAPAETQTPAEIAASLTPEQKAELKAMGFVLKEDLEAEKKAEQEAANYAKFEADKAKFLAEHDGKDGLPKAEEAKLLTFMQENSVYNFDVAYKTMYMDQILQAKAQELLTKKVAPVSTEKPAPGTGVNPPAPQTVDFNNPKSVMAAMEDILGNGQ